MTEHAQPGVLVAARPPQAAPLRAAFVSGTKYSLRSVWEPVLRDLSAFAATKLYVFDYPEHYPIHATVEALRADGVIESYRMIPDNRHVVRHHWTMRAIGRELRHQALDVVVLSADFMPMHQYVIGAARRRDAVVVALQTEAPTLLLRSYRDARRGLAGANGAQAGPRRPLAGRVRGVVSRLVRPASARDTLRRLGGALRARVKTSRHYLTQCKLLPMLLTGKTFHMYPYERSGAITFASRRVDCAIVYSDRVRQALRFFFPEMRVIVARHPQSDNCRCATRAPDRALLVALGSPWSFYVGEGNSIDDIERRWTEAILRATGLQAFARVTIRPHPRERELHHAERLAKRLRRHGLVVAVADPTAQTLPEIVCDYAGVLGTESGALTEAAESCREAFVVAVEAIQGRRGQKALVEDYSDLVVAVPDASALRAEHFVRRRDVTSTLPSAGEVIRQLVEARACASR